MVLKAIMNKLATGSITNIYTQGNYQTYMNSTDTNELLTPYVLVYDDFPIDAYYKTVSSIRHIAIDAHYPVGYIDQLNKYIEEEVIQLLHRQVLTDSEGYSFQIFATMYMSGMVEPNDDRSISGGNDDGTISRNRKFFIPRIGT